MLKYIVLVHEIDMADTLFDRPFRDERESWSHRDLNREENTIDRR